MPQGNIDTKALSKLLKKSFSDFGVNEFRPCVIYNRSLNATVILEEDCSYTEEQTDSNIAILRKNHGEDAGKVVGVVVYQWSRWLKDLTGL